MPGPVCYNFPSGLMMASSGGRLEASGMKVAEERENVQL